MTKTPNSKPPLWFWIVGILALLWNLAGVYAYLSEVFMTDSTFAALPEAQQTLYKERPLWVGIAFALAVFLGAFGTLGLLFRKRWAVLALLFSFTGVLGQNIHHFFLSDTFTVIGHEYMIMPILVMLIAISLVIFARSMLLKEWYV